jgi:hypothetical protein
MDIAQLKEAIARAGGAAEQSSVRMYAVRDRTREAHAMAISTAHDSRHDELTSGLDKLGGALKEAAKVIELLGSARDSANEYVAKL